MPNSDFQKIIQWLQCHPGLFSWQEVPEGLELKELFSQKILTLKKNAVEKIEIKTNAFKPEENYTVLLFSGGHQLVLATQGFVFPPDFSNTGPLNLPSPVYCMQDFQQLFGRLQHVAAEANRGREALDLIMVLIAILDGAKKVGLDVDQETQGVEKILRQLEKGETLPPVHNH